MSFLPLQTRIRNQKSKKVKLDLLVSYLHTRSFVSQFLYILVYKDSEKIRPHSHNLPVLDKVRCYLNTHLDLSEKAFVVNSGKWCGIIVVTNWRWFKTKAHINQRPKRPELIPVSLAWSMPRSTATPPLDGMLVHRRVTPISMSRIPIYTPGWRETKWS